MNKQTIGKEGNRKDANTNDPNGPTILRVKVQIWLGFPVSRFHLCDILQIYQAWETDSIISGELWRNLGLALGAVGAVSLVMLGNLQLCLMVMACVMLTLVDVVGTLHFWDVTIDVISCVNIILATGLCVDYSVHLAHSFSVATGGDTIMLCYMAFSFYYFPFI